MPKACGLPVLSQGLLWRPHPRSSMQAPQWSGLGKFMQWDGCTETIMETEGWVSWQTTCVLNILVQAATRSRPTTCPEHRELCWTQKRALNSAGISERRTYKNLQRNLISLVLQDTIATKTKKGITTAVKKEKKKQLWKPEPYWRRLKI